MTLTKLFCGRKDDTCHVFIMQHVKIEFLFFRVFIGVFKGEIAAIEVLLDNENWARGEARARAWDWVRPEGYTSVRAFAVCSPAPPESAAG